MASVINRLHKAFAYMIVAFLVSLVPATVSASPWDDIPSPMNDSLQDGVGLVLFGEWTKGRNRVNPRNTNEEIHQAINDGFSHITFFVNVDPIFNLEGEPIINPRLGWIPFKFENVINQVREFSEIYPDVSFFIVAKSYADLDSSYNQYDANAGVRTTSLYHHYENRPEIRQAYIEMWQEVATMSADIPVGQLGFGIMNEPEFHNIPGNVYSQRDLWAQYATEIVDSIREITPNRVILLNGVDKSLVHDRSENVSDDFESLVPILDRDNIIYGFHYFKHNDFTQHYSSASGHNPGHALTERQLNDVRQDMMNIAAHARNSDYPIILDEFGTWGPYINPETGRHESGATAEDRARYAETIYDILSPAGVAMTWYAMQADNTPYVRTRIHEDPHGVMEAPYLIDTLLWEALELEPRQ